MEVGWGCSREQTQFFRHDELCLMITNPFELLVYNRIKWAAMRVNLSSGVREQHRRKPAYASAQSDQRLCYSLFAKYYM